VILFILYTPAGNWLFGTAPIGGATWLLAIGCAASDVDARRAAQSLAAPNHHGLRMRQTLPPLIQALLDPARYPDPAARVELIETHASWLLLAGDFAYKIKKPLKSCPSSTTARSTSAVLCCEAELRLNRRFAPQLYLAVVPIVGEAE
jgi:hypothetical protein